MSPRLRTAAILNTTSPQRSNRFWWNFAWWRKFALKTLKNAKFWVSEIQDGGWPLSSDISRHGSRGISWWACLCVWLSVCMFANISLELYAINLYQFYIEYRPNAHYDSLAIAVMYFRVNGWRHVMHIIAINRRREKVVHIPQQVATGFDKNLTNTNWPTRDRGSVWYKRLPCFA